MSRDGDVIGHPICETRLVDLVSAQCIQRAFPSNCFGNSTDIVASEQAINRLSRDFGKSRSDLAEIPSEQGIIREWVRAASVITANNIGTTVTASIPAPSKPTSATNQFSIRCVTTELASTRFKSLFWD